MHDPLNIFDEISAKVFLFLLMLTLIFIATVNGEPFLGENSLQVYEIKVNERKFTQ